ncbi:bifunctional 2-polyprenyl-6-hydroxyphenol methylase/3-demethylubiquinol 3-O-methyltransferase UbiG [Mycobacterium sp. 3519A]|uniref:class I SAM-dependent methyltransferase n=1 Tax=Mycobacterium sp. 3519A TaxID=2057184 RepID=UPI000C799DC8|nr:class I SAM-dependent methyltransferase [Mycobacterium sp. 3519A]
MFIKSAPFYDALYGFVDYSAAVERLREVIQANAPHAATLLDVGCGTGRHLRHFQKFYDVEGLDLNGLLLETARERCPDVRFHEASMLDFSLPRRFDVVTCLFSAVGYVQTVENMRRAIANMARHVERGGLLIVEPWFEPDRYWTGTITANHVDRPDMKICWMYTSKRDGQLSVLDIHYLVGTPDRVEHFEEQHRIGLFTREEHMSAMTEAGLDVIFDPEGPFKRGLYVGRASGAGQHD